MKTFITSAFFGTLIALTLTSTASWSSGVDSIPASSSDAMSTMNHTNRTSCPFVNSLIYKGLITSDQPTVEELVDAAAKYGVNRTLMEKLASAVAEPGSRTVILSKLLLAHRIPVHLGALARADGKLETVDVERLDQLRNYSTDGMISFEQLQKYQKLCWNKTLNGMGIVDKMLSDGELQLLWGLFGAYRVKQNGVDSIPFDLVYSFLRDNTLPDSFKINEKDPATYWGIIGSILYSRFCSGN